MIYRFVKNAIALLLFVCTQTIQAQISDGGTPLLIEHPEWFTQSATSLKALSLKAPNRAQLEAEDAEMADPIRFAAPMTTSISLEKNGRWTNTTDGGRVWHLALESKDALGLVFIFDKLILPNGARMFAFRPDGKQVLGAYSHKSNSSSGMFTIGVVDGEKTILELYEPSQSIGQTQMELNRVDYAYNENLYHSQSNVEAFGFNTAAPCQVNVNCTAGNSWQQEKKAVARIKMVLAQGTGWCTGTLVANQKGDRTPFMLSAYHCIDGFTPYYPLWTFDFWFESDSCSNPVYPPNARAIMGCEVKSGWKETDFLLLELEPIPDHYDVYYCGINRSLASEPPTTTFIHHASGDIKKITVDNGPAVVSPKAIQWSNNFYSGVWTHFEVTPDVGYFQPGSSGAALFDPQKRIIGQLHGGDYNVNNPCTTGFAYFGRISLSWDNANADDSTQTLAFHLDPMGVAGQTIDGYVPSDPKVTIAGRVRSHWGANMSGVQVHISGDYNFVTLTDAMGAYEFKNLEPGGDYTIEVKKDGMDLNGVNSFDLLKIRKFMLDIEPLSAWGIIAGDALNNNDLSTFDVIEIRKLSLGIISGYTASDSWRFYDGDHTFINPENPFLNMPKQKMEFTDLQEDALHVNFTGVKVGDVDASAAPNL